MKENLKYYRTCVCNINYHMVWSVKYRRKILNAEIEAYLQELVQEIAEDKGFTEQSIAIEGSLVEKIKGVPSLIEDAICVFCMAPTENTRIHVIPNSNGASVGAAIAAALCEC